MSLYALLNIWLNYDLSIKRVSFVYLLLFGVAVQGILIVLFHSSLLEVASILALSSLVLDVRNEIFFRYLPAQKGEVEAGGEMREGG